MVIKTHDDMSRYHCLFDVSSVHTCFFLVWKPLNCACILVAAFSTSGSFKSMSISSSSCCCSAGAWAAGASVLTSAVVSVGGASLLSFSFCSLQKNKIQKNSWLLHSHNFSCTHLHETFAGRKLPIKLTGVCRISCSRGAEWWNLTKISPKQADLTVFALNPQGAHAPCAPPWIRQWNFFSYHRYRKEILKLLYHSI